MANQMSRRGLFRAFRAEAASSKDTADATSLIARIGDGCVEPRGVTCRRCGDECETRAITFRPLGSGRSQPRVDAASCTGCAACVGVCPVQAIVMVPAERIQLAAGLAELARAQ